MHHAPQLPRPLRVRAMDAPGTPHPAPANSPPRADGRGRLALSARGTSGHACCRLGNEVRNREASSSRHAKVLTLNSSKPGFPGTRSAATSLHCPSPPQPVEAGMLGQTRNLSPEVALREAACGVGRRPRPAAGRARRGAGPGQRRRKHGSPPTTVRREKTGRAASTAQTEPAFAIYFRN